MSDAHTPGPWHTKREGFSTVYVEASLGNGWVQEVAACGPTAAGQDQQEANALLIAAAPDLLEALCAYRKKFPDHENEAFVQEVQDLGRMARAAIAKATGGQS